MTEKVSQSHTGQNEPKPTREERDAAFSSGAGRKASEDPVVKHPKEPGTQANELKAPIGTELETKAEGLE